MLLGGEQGCRRSGGSEAKLRQFNPDVEDHWRATVMTVSSRVEHSLSAAESLMWGKFKDLFDKLRAEMDEVKFYLIEFKKDLNAQFDLMRSAKEAFILQLNEAIVDVASAQEELSARQKEYNEDADSRRLHQQRD